MFYEPVLENRHFSRELSYADVHVASLSVIIDAFEVRIDDWYIKPIKAIEAASGHYAFAALALECLLIDTLSQFERGVSTSSRSVFMSFVKKWLKPYGRNLKHPIGYEEVKTKNGKTTVTVKQYTNRAEILYFGFRCGILHQAHAPLFCSVDPGGLGVREVKRGKVRYASDHSDCPSVKVNPWRLAQDLDDVFRKYLGQLRNKSTRYNTLRISFQSTFTEVFGIDIRKATL